MKVSCATPAMASLIRVKRPFRARRDGVAKGMTRKWLYVATVLYALLIASLWLPLPATMASTDQIYRLLVLAAGAALVWYWWKELRGDR